MRKSIAAAVALTLVASLLGGCGSNVSDREDGKITETTGTVATMPSTDTAPTVMPHETTNPTEHTGRNETTDGTHETGGIREDMEGAMDDITGESQSRARQAHPGNSKMSGKE